MTGTRRCAAFAARRPDVALLDIGMPKSQRLRSGAADPRGAGGAGVLLIAITGWAQDADKARSRAAGFDHHLTKPIEPEVADRITGICVP